MLADNIVTTSHPLAAQAGLPCAAAVIPNAQLREQFTASEKGLMSGVVPLNHIASQACFDDRSDWLPNLLDQLRRVTDRSGGTMHSPNFLLIRT